MKKRLFLLLVLTMLCGAAAAEDTGYCTISGCRITSTPAASAPAGCTPRRAKA